MPRTTVVAVLHDSAALLDEFAEGLRLALEGVDDTATVLVDSGSSDQSVAIARSLLPAATVHCLGANLGYAAGINAGLGLAPPEAAAVVLNPDVRLQPGSVTELLRVLDQPGVGIAVPRLLDAHGRLCPSLRRAPSISRVFGEALLGGRLAGHLAPLGEMVRSPHAYENERDVCWATGAALAISRRCLDAVGDWDESFFLYSEETEFALRAHDRGFRVRYTPEAVATHLGGDCSTSPFLWSLQQTNRVRLYRRRHLRLPSAMFLTGVLLSDGLRATRPTSRAAIGSLLELARSGDAPSRPNPRPLSSPTVEALR
jgi:N-acetylglucosaminyl-diphospho-decaprenol L-rhamnosyltransferase